MQLSILRTLVTFPLAASFLQADFIDTFDESGSFSSNYAGFSDFAEQATGGLNDSGGVALSSNSQIAVRQAGVDFSTANGHQLSVYFIYNGANGTGRGFSIGFTSGAADVYESSATSTGTDIRVNFTGSGADDLYGLELLDNGTILEVSSKNVTMVDGGWYLLELKIAEISEGALLGVTASLSESQADGTVGALLKSIDNQGEMHNVSSVLAGADSVFPFIGGQNPTSRAASFADNFEYLSLALPDPVLGFTDTFDEAESFSANYAGFSDFSEQTTGGLNDGGVIALSSNSQIAVRQEGIDFAADNGHHLSVFFVYNGANGTGRGLSIGFTTGAEDVYSSSASSTGSDVRLNFTGSGADDLYGLELLSNGAIQEASPKEITMIDGNWYFLELEILEVRNGNVFGVTASLHDAQADGTVGDLLQVMDNDGAGYNFFTELGFASTAYPYFGGQNPTSRAASFVDSFSYTPFEVLKTTVFAPRGTPEAIDGIIESAWDEIPFQEVTLPDVPEYMPSRDDFSARWKTMWDEDYFYVLIEVNDDTVVPLRDGTRFWSNDVAELFVDMDYTRNVDRAVRPNDFQLIVPRVSTDSELYNGSGPFPLPLEFLEQVTTDGVTVTELALPWSNISGVSPVAGNAVGFEMFVKDYDEGDSIDGQLNWVPSDRPWENPSSYGTIIMYEGNSALISDTVGSSPQAGMIYQSEWFGEFEQAGEFLFHHQIGWIWAGLFEDPNSLIFWNYTLGTYMWSSQGVFPILYDFSAGTWVYMIFDEQGQLYIYDYSLGEWILVEA